MPGVIRPLVVALVVLQASAGLGPARPQDAGGPDADPSRPGERILYVGSYHPGYPWGDGILDGFVRALQLEPAGDDLWRGPGGLTARTCYLNAKREPSPACIGARVDLVCDLIAAWRPAIVVTADDDAAQHLVAPHLCGGSVPVVFCGVNWDAAALGLPCENVTGMVEVSQVADLVAELRKLAAGDRGGLLVLDSLAGRREAEIYRERLGLDLTVRYVLDFAGWAREFVALQDEVDYLMVLQNVTGAADYDQAQAKRHTATFTRIPTGTVAEAMVPCVLVSFIKSPQEQGAWAARTAIEILAGAAPDSMPIAANRDARIFLHMSLAESLGIRFDIGLIERATFVEERNRP